MVTILLSILDLANGVALKSGDFILIGWPVPRKDIVDMKHITRARQWGN